MTELFRFLNDRLTLHLKWLDTPIRNEMES